MPAKYRKRPVEIEAVKFDGSNHAEILKFVGKLKTGAEPGTVKIETLEGVMVANTGDWIIKGVKGEFYPCKPDIFIATYDVA